MTDKPVLARRLGPFDAAMIVMGGIIGSGIFMNPAVVARHVGTPMLVLAAWVAGGLVALAGAFVYAELAARRPDTGGQYSYLREAFHPALAFVYGWTLLLVIQTGGMAAVGVTFARYFNELSASPLSDRLIAVLAIMFLTAINCIGVRAGGTLQNVFMVLKIGAIVGLVVVGLTSDVVPRWSSGENAASPSIAGFGAALVPVLFAYGGWQTANFIAGEMRDPRRDLPRGLLFGVLGVVVLYLAVNAVCLRVFSVDELAATKAPASDVMRLAMGETGARLMAIGIAISTIGFLSQAMLTAPRVYYAMAEDRLFFKAVGWVHPRTRVPVVAIALQGVLASVIAVLGVYEQILAYVVSADFIFFGLTGLCVFLLRKTDASPASFSVPGHPWTTIAFVLACALVVVATVVSEPANSLIGLAIAAAGLPVYFLWRRKPGINDP